MKNWLTWPLRWCVFLAWFAREAVVANVAIVRDNLTPGQDSTPVIARVATRCRTDAEVTFLAALLTLTPGTLTLGTQTRQGVRELFVHEMYIGSTDGLRTEVRRMEEHMLRAVRRSGDPT